MSLSLFRVTFQTATSPERPTFWPQQSGFVALCLFASGVDDADSRARAIVGCLPFLLPDDSFVEELDVPHISVVPEKDSSGEALREVREEMEAHARLTGLAFTFLPLGYARRAQTGAIQPMRFLIDPDHKPEGSA